MSKEIKTILKMENQEKQQIENQEKVTIHNHIIQQPTPKWSAGTAVLLSFIIPGAGQMYKGSVIVGILWLIFVSIGYMFLIFPGIILHIICMVTAASGDPYKK